jgi:hypothetical protein
MRIESTMKSATITCLIVLCWAGALPTTVMAQQAPPKCGELTNAIGPFDYRVDKQHLPIVESAHFTTEVEMLIRGKGGYLGQDIDYTLRAFPNHHRALLSAVRYGERMKSAQPSHLRYTVECYLERATRFRPDDAVSRMLFAQFLYKQARQEDARTQLAAATALARDNPFTHYNIGLVHAEGKDYARALERAHAAMALGFPRTGLKDQLVAAGQWTEPAAAAATRPEATASVPAARP